MGGKVRLASKLVERRGRDAILAAKLALEVPFPGVHECIGDIVGKDLET